MAKPADAKASHTSRNAFLISAALLVLLAVVAGVAWITGAGFGAGTMRTEDLLSSSEFTSRDATAELCGTEQCVAGWSTAIGNFLEFDSAGAAEQFATYLGDDGRRWKNIVLDFRGYELSFEQRRLAIDTLYSGKDWS
ncbi:hypothetical protein [Glutamicibacter sp. PS]|uniref:hypothetical protein n=1 Tax=Glutamicibacter sp. PS TaxID=3075634 RepID=UPI002847372D|nr:hypothetical protein [Glutamicibacter sp. PS]MDR4533417.1 hypothetical protein [Glutamicibacter sp. PS]